MTTAAIRSSRPWASVAAFIGLVAATVAFAPGSRASADGLMKGLKSYKGSINESSQEAVIIFHDAKRPGDAVEDLILKVFVQGKAKEDVKNFAWIVPFPNEPTVEKEDPKLFEELHNYVERRLAARAKKPQLKGGKGGAGGALGGVEVLAKKVVGAFDVAIVREKEKGALNKWLDTEGYQTIDDADDVLAFYREKNYVFACIKVTEAQLNRKEPAGLHPLRFTFKTGGRDGIFFPMKLTGLQTEPFDVNLYVFYRWWLNDHLSKFGYEHRGFTRRYRDWDTKFCKPDAGKKYYAPEKDHFLKSYAGGIPSVVKLMQKLHPRQRYYLTNIYARKLDPAEVRKWKNDLWLFPYYTDRSMVPYDARRGGPAAVTRQK